MRRTCPTTNCARRPWFHGLATWMALILVLEMAGLPKSASASIWIDPPSFPPGTEDPLNKGVWDSNGGACYPITSGGRQMSPVHAIVVPSPDYQKPLGRVVLFETFESPGRIFIYELDTPDTIKEIVAENATGFPQEYFCTGYTVLQDGDLLLAGGDWGRHVLGTSNPRRFVPADPWVSVLDNAATPTLTMIAPMPGLARYYPTALTEPDGSVLVIGGDHWEDANGDSLVGTTCPDNPNCERTNTYPWVRFRVDGDDARYGA